MKRYRLNKASTKKGNFRKKYAWTCSVCNIVKLFGGIMHFGICSCLHVYVYIYIHIYIYMFMMSASDPKLYIDACLYIYIYICMNMKL